jgi:hypothetical protein
MIFSETSLMFIDEKYRMVPQYLISEMRNLLPKEIVEIYSIWSRKSTINGDNETMKIDYGNKTYIFSNHYWD